MKPRRSRIFKFRVEEDLVEAVAAAAAELRITPSEAGRVALKLWLSELDRVPEPDHMPSRLVQPVVSVGYVEVPPSKVPASEPPPLVVRAGESEAEAALRRLREHVAAVDAARGDAL